MYNFTLLLSHRKNKSSHPNLNTSVIIEESKYLKDVGGSRGLKQKSCQNELATEMSGKNMITDAMDEIQEQPLYEYIEVSHCKKLGFDLFQG